MLAKPTAFSREIAKYERRIAKSKTKKAADARQARDWAKLKRAVYVRDEGRCCVCGITATWTKGDPRTTGTAHHIVYRSAGGRDELANLVWICGLCHDDEHRHLLHISGTASRLSSMRGL